MRYYVCSCGETQSFGSLGPEPCSGCEKCHTRIMPLGWIVNHEKEEFPKPISHEYIIRYDEQDGTKYEVCRRCWSKK